MSTRTGNRAVREQFQDQIQSKCISSKLGGVGSSASDVIFFLAFPRFLEWDGNSDFLVFSLRASTHEGDPIILVSLGELVRFWQKHKENDWK